MAFIAIGISGISSAGVGPCGSHILGFVRGNQYPYTGNKFQMAGMYCDTQTNEIFKDGTYWLSSDGYTGEGFIAVLQSNGPWTGIILRNTHNGRHKDRSTREFSLYLGSSPDGPWGRRILDNKELVDSREQDPPPLQTIPFPSENGRYLKFDVEEYWGVGAGLQYLDMIPK